MSLDSSIFAKEIKLHAPTASVTPVLLDAQLPLFSLYESNFNHGSGLSKYQIDMRPLEGDFSSS